MSNETFNKTATYEYNEWISIRWHNAPDLQLPRILLIGDDIVGDHGPLVHNLLQDKLCVDYFATSRHITDVKFMNELEFMFSDRNYIMIIFNNGLHGFSTDDGLYGPALREALANLKQKTPHLAWRNSTPILQNGNLNVFDPKLNRRIIRRNAEAAAIATRMGLPQLDLYTPMAKQKNFFNEDGIHFKDEGRQYQAELIAAFVREQLTLQ